MIRPSEVNTSELFWNSALQNMQRELIARNITILSQTIAEAKKDDRWHAFSPEEYDGFRAATGEQPVSYAERAEMNGLVIDGYLAKSEDNSFSVTNTFLGVVAQFATPQSAESVIAK